MLVELRWNKTKHEHLRLKSDLQQEYKSVKFRTTFLYSALSKSERDSASTLPSDLVCVLLMEVLGLTVNFISYIGGLEF